MMFATMKTRFAASLARLFPGVARRFVRHQRGAAAVETALVMWPFIALLVMTMETALVFLAQQTMESAAAEAKRLIMTGQAQGHGQTQCKRLDAAGFKKAICDKNYLLFDCNDDLYVDVQTFPSFGGVDPKVEFGDDGKPKTKFQNTDGGDIVVARLIYNWPIISPLAQEHLAHASSSGRWLVATAAFSNEPFPECKP